uniref:Cuticle protein 8 n=1 Tax=Cacopsylla melanoneura TaxID=428564 RepID=A0A8D9E6X1_9HEMI
MFQASCIFCLLQVLNLVHADSSQQVEYKLPLPAARSVRSQSQKLEPEPAVNPEYHFRYFVHNEDTGDFKSQEESRDGKSVVGRYTVAEPTGHVREVKYTADEKHGFRADVKIHPPGTFETKNAGKRSADAEEKSDTVEEKEDVQADKPSEEDDQHADETKSSEELLHNDKPQQPEEMTDEEVEKTLENKEHILNPQEHEHSNTDEEKSADAGHKEEGDNLIITVNAEKKPLTEVKADPARQPVHIAHAVKDPISQPAYPFIPHFNAPYPYAQRIPNPAVADVPAAHHIPHPAVADYYHSIPHPAVIEHHLRTPGSIPPPAPVHPAPIPAALPSFIYRDHPISPVSPIFIQQPSNQAHHYLPGNVQDILAAKQANIQDVENTLRQAAANEGRHEERYGTHSYQIHPKPMMFQLADPPMHVLLPSSQFDQSYKALTYLAPNYPYNLPYVYQPSQEDLGRAGIPLQFLDHRNYADEAQKSILNYNNFIKPIVNHIPLQYIPEKFRPVSSTASPLNADQVSSTPQGQQEAPHQHEIQINKGQTPAPATASSPSHYFPFLYPLTTFLQRPFFQQHVPHQVAHSVQPQQVPVQQNNVQIQQDNEKVQKPAAQPVQSAPAPQQVAAPAANEQQRYYFIQPSFPSNGQYRYNAGSPPAPQKPAATPVKPTPVPLRAQPVPTQVPVPAHNHNAHSIQEKSSNLYSFPYNSPVALLVLPFDQQHPQQKGNENNGVRDPMGNFYRAYKK